MSTINLLEYSKSIEPNKATKIRVFNEYFCEKFSIQNYNQDIDIKYLQEMDIEFILKSLENYIDVNSVTAQNPADTYVRAINELLEYISKKYGANNAVLIDMIKNKEFVERTKEITSQLRTNITKDIASDDDYERLVNCVEVFLEEHKNLEVELNKEIDLLMSHKKKVLRVYASFISVIFAKFVIEYGLKYNVIIDIKAEDIDIINSKITINGITLPLRAELQRLLKIYLPIRNELIDYHGVTTGNLLIKYMTGQRFIKGDYSSAFRLLEKHLNGFKSESFSSKRILEMLDNGIDTYLIWKLTGFDVTRCIDIQSNNRSNNRSEEYCVDRLKEFLSDKKHVDAARFMTCPFCRVKKEASIENWIIVKFEDDDKKYVACKGCKGLASREHV